MANITNESTTLLPPPFTHTLPAPILLTQGAEALVFRTHFLTPAHACALKYRPIKTWRHPTLDARLTRHRILSEARILAKCKREGISVPTVLALDWEGGGVGDGKRFGGWMMMEWIEGDTVKVVLNRWLAGRELGIDWEAEAVGLMERIGGAVGRLHEIGVVHGDLTTSNMMLRPMEEKIRAKPLGGEVVLIDFGLATHSLQDEDKAVDLYVLERAFGSTHPTAESLFAEVLKAYGRSYKKAKVVLKRLEDVRMRGRKRSMLG